MNDTDALAREIVRSVVAIRRAAGASVDPETVAVDAVRAYVEVLARRMASRDDGPVEVIVTAPEGTQ